MYRGNIEALAARSNTVSEESKQSISIAAIIDEIEIRYPGYRIDRVYYPTSAGAPYRAHINLPDGSHDKVIEIGNSTGKVFGVGRTTDFYRLIFELHHELGLDESGAYVVGAVGLVLGTSAALGFWIWWPGWRRIPQALRIRKVSTDVRDLYDIHRVVGAVCIVMIVVTATSGFALAYAGPLRSALVADAVTPTKIVKSSNGPALSADELITVARAAMPGVRVRDLRFEQPGNLLTTVVFFRDTAAGAGPFHRVWVDPFSGDVRGVADSRMLGPVNSLLDWMYPIHTELGLAMTGKLILTVSGLAVLLLSITGPLLWWQKRRRRAHASVRRNQVESRR